MHAYVGVGSNLGDRAGNLLFGVRGMLAAGLRVRRLSSVYETEPVGVADAQPAFLNMVAELGGPLPSPEELLARLLKIEHAHGRRRERPRAPRTLDLDLLLYGDERRETELLTLPHPRMHLRRFVLAPLVELAPAARHPTTGHTYSELLAAAGEDARVELWQPAARADSG
ncbi:MAG: 2-amino-4-hydroxy-6-hydroxymethyldihydropteridine diphosphokinase [Acidobacteriota bacterium]|nr:2-amino-4-hydroxy-6-hydroxymethyldihydropteridine diphosphokinase [Acidobacteriota bacterium]